MIDEEIQQELNKIQETLKKLDDKLNNLATKKIQDFYATILNSIDKCQKFTDHYNMLKEFRNSTTDTILIQHINQLLAELNNPKALNSSVKIDLEKSSYKTIPTLRAYCLSKIKKPET